MRATQFLITTSKESPSDAEVISHKLMLRAGMIRKLASGLYSWLPLGLRVLRKVERIVREEMDKAGAQELLMPVVQPAELWEESGRWHQYGPELLRIKDRHKRAFCLGPTHEEVITTIARNEISSYKQLPQCFYQIQTKFRDEIRPRFGVMRSREFIMKDAYSFHLNNDSLEQTYDSMYAAYSAIFSRVGLDFRPVLADTGSIGGSSSHEFHVLADSGEDDIAISNQSDYAANVELAEAVAPKTNNDIKQYEREKIATPEQSTIDSVSKYLDVSPCKILKTLIVHGKNNCLQDAPTSLVALVLRGDHELNTVKAEKIDEIAQPLQLASNELVMKQLDMKVGSIGPIDLNIPVIVDRAAAIEKNFVCGANETGYHFKNANWNNDLVIKDIRNVVAGDASPCGKGEIVIKRGIEVGHIFQLGSKYSEAMNMRIQDPNGKSVAPTMGCYGIGVTRVVASAIEQNHDDNGIIWPDAIAPFELAIVPINAHKSERVQQACTALYRELLEANVDVLFMDEQKARLGVMLADIELMGIPHRVVIGERGLESGVIEYRHRRQNKNESIDSADLAGTILKKLEIATARH